MLHHCNRSDVWWCPPPAALYPLDTIKTRLQTATSGGGLAALMRSGGGKALYSGVWGNLAGVVPASAIFMGVYEPVKQARCRPPAWHTSPIHEPLCAGVLLLCCMPALLSRLTGCWCPQK